MELRVGIIMDKTCKNNVMEVKRIPYQILSLKSVFEQETFSIITTYAASWGWKNTKRKSFGKI